MVAGLPPSPGVTAGGEFVVAALAGEQRPTAAIARSVEGAAVGVGSVAVVWVAPPTRAVFKFHLELAVDQQTEAFLEAQAVDVRGFQLFIQRLEHAVQAQGLQLVQGRMGQHGEFPCVQW